MPKTPKTKPYSKTHPKKTKLKDSTKTREHYITEILLDIAYVNNGCFWFSLRIFNGDCCSSNSDFTG